MIEQRQYCVRHRSANVVKVNIHPFRTGFTQCLTNVVALVIDPDVHPEFIAKILILLLTTASANHMAAFELGDLTDRHSHSTRSSGNNHGFTFLWLTDVQQTKVSR